MFFKFAFEPLRVLKIAQVIPFTIVIFLLIVVICYILVKRTKYGRRIVAIGGNEENARLSGTIVVLAIVICNINNLRKKGASVSNI